MTSSATVLVLLGRVDCIDGVAAYLESLVTGLRAAGDHVVLVSGKVTTPLGSEGRRIAIASAVTDWIIFEEFHALPVIYLRQLLSIIRRNNVSVLSPQGFSMLPASCVLSVLSSRPVVAMYHPSLQGKNAKAMTGKLSAKQRLLYRLVTTIFRPTRFLASSQQVARFLREDCHIPAELINEQVLGIETDFYRPPSKAERDSARLFFGLDKTNFVAVLPGRLALSKGHDVAAAAVRLLRDQRPDLKIVCLFPGGGGQREVIEADVLRDDADRDSFRFLGFVERETLRQTYWAADIVLLPSRMEGFGLVVAEAMCCGAIAIRTPSGGWQDQIIEGKTGYVVPFNDPAALANAMVKVADATNRAAMREETMAFAMKKFAKARMIEGTSSIYREIGATRQPYAA
jgi:glycosyltransferase involved in cell wall biosynthesis